MLEYPPEVSVRSFEVVGPESDSRPCTEGRRGVEMSSEPEPGAWTADDVRPAVCTVGKPLSPDKNQHAVLTSSSGSVTGSTGAITTSLVLAAAAASGEAAAAPLLSPPSTNVVVP